MLWVNRHRLVGHNVWFVQLLKSIDYITATQDQLLEVCSLLSESKKIPTAEDSVKRRECWDLMCARACRPHFDVECAIQVLNQLVRYNPVREYALTFLDQCDEQVKTTKPQQNPFIFFFFLSDLRLSAEIYR